MLKGVTIGAEQDFQLGNSLLCGGKACPLFLNLCCLLAGLRFLYHSDKLGSVMLCIFGNGFEHFGNKGQYHIFIDTVLCRAELSNWDFAVLGTGILRNTLAVVGTVDIHLAAAIGTIKQACEGSCFAPARTRGPGTCAPAGGRTRSACVPRPRRPMARDRPASAPGATGGRSTWIWPAPRSSGAGRAGVPAPRAVGRRRFSRVS